MPAILPPTHQEIDDGFPRLASRQQKSAVPAGAPGSAATPAAINDTPDAGRQPTALITPAQAPELLLVGTKVLERWRTTGEGPSFVRLSGKTIWYRRSDVEAFVADRVRTSTAAA